MAACCRWFTYWLKNTSICRKFRNGGNKKNNKVKASRGDAIAGDKSFLPIPLHHPSVETLVAETDVANSTSDTSDELNKSQLKLLQLKKIDDHLREVTKKLTAESKLRHEALDRIKKYKSVQHEVVRLRHAILKKESQMRRHYDQLETVKTAQKRKRAEDAIINDEDINEALAVLDSSYADFQSDDEGKTSGNDNDEESQGVSENSKTESELCANTLIEEDSQAGSFKINQLSTGTLMKNKENLENMNRDLSETKLGCYEEDECKQKCFKVTNAYKWRRGKLTSKRSGSSRWPY